MQPPTFGNDPQSRSGRNAPVPPAQQTGGYRTNGADPFDDTGFAPELRAERSENLYRRSDSFWRSPGTEDPVAQPPRDPDYFNHPAQFEATRASKPRGRRGSWVIALVSCVAILLMVVAILFASPFFAVREIRVVGNSRVPTEEIVERSGLKEGMNRFWVNAEDVTERVQGNCYLICELVHMPDRNTVEIRVREREVAAVIDYNGLMYYADNRGMILEEFANRTSIPLDGKVLVGGLSIRRCDVGRTITLTDSSQLDVYNEILVELKVMSALDRFEELDMSSMESIFLTTWDGYSVRLGDGTDIHRKLRSALLTLDALQGTMYGVGTIDVTTPVNPTFYPVDADQSRKE